MDLKELKEQVEAIITNLKDHGTYPKENDLVDYKSKLNVVAGDPPVETFLKALGKDCISYANGQGGILILGLKEDQATGKIEDIGLEADNQALFDQLDLNDLTQKFKKITGLSFSVDIQTFTMSVRHYAYVLIPKSSEVLVPKSDFQTYGIKAGEVTYRKGSTNIHANKDSSDFNTFVQIKANEKSKEFMEIWSKIFPEIVDINPKEVLIVNPKLNTVYGYNSVGNILSAGSVDIEQSEDGVVSIVLSTISAGEIGKLTDTEGKPLYKIMGHIYQDRAKLNMTNLQKEVKKKANFRFHNLQLKAVMNYLGWVNMDRFPVENPPENTVNHDFPDFLWVETTNDIPKKTKVRFSPTGVQELVAVINKPELHQAVFGKTLSPVAKPAADPEKPSPLDPTPASAPPPPKVKKARVRKPKQNPLKK